jgi:lysyl-tRNA synthetase class 1
MPFLDKLVDHAVAYYRDFVRPEKRYRHPTDTERAALADLAETLRGMAPEAGPHAGIGAAIGAGTGANPRANPGADTDGGSQADPGGNPSADPDAGPKPDPGADPGAETIQNLVYEVGKRHNFPELRAWFACLYQVLLGQQEGPRFGGFIALYGIAETIALIEAALSRPTDAA